MSDEELRNRDPRKYLSKSFMTGAEMCGQRAWLDLHYPMPFRMTEQVLFGKAVDLAVQVVLTLRDAGYPVRDHAHRILEAVQEVISSEEVEPPVSVEEVMFAALEFDAWVDDIHAEPQAMLDLRGATRQHHVRLPLPGIGMIDGHPDLILRDGTILDIKTSAKSKPVDAAAQSYSELGFYALVREYETGVRPPRVGYLTWVRSRSPYWQLVTADVTERMMHIAAARAEAIAWARRGDEILNQGEEEPRNYTFVNGPRFPGLCGNCSHNPAFGGRCHITEGV